MYMETLKNSTSNPGKLKGLALFFKYIGAKIADLFEPEEVEITFTVEGQTDSYTYTKVSEKQAA